MSQIAPVGSNLMSPQPVQTPPAGGTESISGGQQAGGSCTAMARTAMVQESYQSMAVSVASNVELMVAQFGATMPADELLRALIVLLLLQQLLEQITGGEQEDSPTISALGQGGGRGGFLLLASQNTSVSVAMESWSYQAMATEAYASTASSAGHVGSSPTLSTVTPTDTGATMNAGDGGHQLDVVA